jgi:2-keto-4-pentenoate hydratase/2-oxohepta-3-ene-1,7-dioic acid hydratase in catechol pathway
VKLCRVGPEGQEQPAIVDQEGRLRDLSGELDDIGPAALGDEALERLRALDLASLPLIEGRPRYGVPWTGASKFVAIGLNYSDHAAEAGMAVPTEPVIFMKTTTSLCGADDDVIQPPHSTQLDWELELGIVIGRKAQYLDEAEALDHVAGYCIVNDVSERAFQMQSSQWVKGKGCDTFGPVGPWLVTRDEVPDPQNLPMWLKVNGRTRQSGNSATMIFGVREIVAYCSRYMTLLPGDVIATGTPPGVGMGIKPAPVWLQPGDVMELWIEGLGLQTQRVVRYAGRAAAA